jgi:hypothetical protein
VNGPKRYDATMVIGGRRPQHMPCPAGCASAAQGKADGRERRCNGSPDHFFLPEYSSIWVVKSSGYDMRTSLICPSLDTTGSSRGCTNPV